MRSSRAEDLRSQFPNIETHIGCTLDELHMLLVHNFAARDFDHSGTVKVVGGKATKGMVLLFVGHDGQLLKHSGPEFRLFESDTADLSSSEGVVEERKWASIAQILCFLDLDKLAYILLYSCERESRPPISQWSVLKLSQEEKEDPRAITRKAIQQRESYVAQLVTDVARGDSDSIMIFEASSIRALCELLEVSPTGLCGNDTPENFSSVRLLPAKPGCRATELDLDDSSNAAFFLLPDLQVPTVGMTRIRHNECRRGLELYIAPEGQSLLEAIS